ncbi:hypothetical protein ANCDUO_09616 [Ancylostoma duodenale]|uniref:Serine-threonine/tyrosine-protein kinase catalytic domain-containing protein n=1 Tax=Ancylostoma duodenale TaxID=51022 RepID=A0A0C2DCH3_9BILA|nr:hypothetical protein ANCDUO_09616 [Ancylostoma duodenale]
MLISGPLCENFDRTLAGRAYYHGLLLREDVPYLLHQNGDFLVRVAQSHPSAVVYVRKGADKMATKLEMVLSVFHDPQGRSSHSKSGKDKENFVSNLIHKLNVRLIKGVALAPWEIQGKHVRIGDLMGGPGPVEVHRCFVKIDGSDREAAGTLISGQSPHAWQTLREMARQGRLLRELKHPCVVQFYGVCTLARPCCFLLEYVSEGKLNLYLIKNRGNLKREELLQMTISAGKLMGRGI